MWEHQPWNHQFLSQLAYLTFQYPNTQNSTNLHSAVCPISLILSETKQHKANSPTFNINLTAKQTPFKKKNTEQSCITQNAPTKKNQNKYYLVAF
jgi:hypothetical protein